MAPLEPWEKVFVNAEAFIDTVHGQIGCVECHSGVQSLDKAIAHENLIAYPSENAEESCGECHPDILEVYPESLHASLTGYTTVLDERTIPEDHAEIEEMFGNHCSECHATCGECHVSQPRLVGSGFIDGHVFNQTPSMTRNCTACHGSRVGNEYLGKHEGLMPDVHFRQGRMTCVDCHNGHDMHGQPDNCQECHQGPEYGEIAPADHRYDGIQSPSCESCHAAVTVGDDGILMHEMHGGELQCQTCHSIEYTSCDGCHVAVSDQTGNPFFATDSSYLGFYIGLNPLKTYDRPYEYVVVRHVPVAEDSFAYYGDNLLPNYDALPTWVYSTPHNIQRNTPQTESCGACHGNPDVFLTADKVAENELKANENVIVREIPASIFSDEVLIEVIPSMEITTTTEITATTELTGTESTESTP